MENVIQYFEGLKEKKLILDYKVGEVIGDNVEVFVKPLVAINFVQVDMKLSS